MLDCKDSPCQILLDRKDWERIGLGQGLKQKPIWNDASKEFLAFDTFKIGLVNMPSFRV